MAGRINYYGNIVSNGLILNLDAARINSYPKTGTQWNDISGLNNNSTLTNGPTFTSSNSGAIVFDGTNDYSTQTYNMSTMTEFSIEFWAKTYNTGTTLVSSNQALAGPNAGGTYLRVNFAPGNSNQTGLLMYVAGTSTGTSFTSVNVPFSSMNLTGYNLYSYTFKNRNTANIYLNGSLKISTDISAIDIPGLGSWYQRIGNYAGSYLWEGEIAITRMYNRILSASEVLQNYNAVKGRFGL